VLETILSICKEVFQLHDCERRRSDYQRVGVLASLPISMCPTKVDTSNPQPEKFQCQGESPNFLLDASDSPCNSVFRSGEDLFRTFKFEAAGLQAAYQLLYRPSNGLNAIFKVHAT
jgi:hypothetical protein